MATPNPSHRPRHLDITPHEAFVLRDMLRLNGCSVVEAVEHAENADQADAAVERALAHAALMRASEECRLAVTPEVGAYLRRCRTEAVGHIRYERGCQARARGGEEEYRFIGCNDQESEQHTRALIDEDLDEISVCDGILARIDAGARQ